MSKQGAMSLWQEIRSRMIGHEIKHRFKTIPDLMDRRMIYAYCRGEHQLQRDTLIRKTKEALAHAGTQQERTKIEGLVDLFDYGPGNCEIWAALNPDASIEDVIERWNSGCTAHLKENGRSPNVRFGDSRIPEWVEPMPDYADYLGDVAAWMLLSRAVISARNDVRWRFKACHPPITLRNLDLTSTVGEICSDRSETPLFVRPKSKMSGARALDDICQSALRKARSATDSARREFTEFGVDGNQFDEALYVVIREEVLRTSSPHDYVH